MAFVVVAPCGAVRPTVVLLAWRSSRVLVAASLRRTFVLPGLPSGVSSFGALLFRPWWCLRSLAFSLLGYFVCRCLGALFLAGLWFAVGCC